MAYVDPGELKYQIDVTLPRMELDANGHYVRHEGKPLHLRSAVRAVKSSDAVSGGAERMQEQLQFIIRWRAGIDTSASVTFRGRRYALEYVDPTPFAGNYMRLKGVSYDEGVGGDHGTHQF